MFLWFFVLKSRKLKMFQMELFSGAASQNQFTVTLYNCGKNVSICISLIEFVYDIKCERQPRLRQITFLEEILFLIILPCHFLL